MALGGRRVLVLWPELGPWHGLGDVLLSVVEALSGECLASDLQSKDTPETKKEFSANQIDPKML